MDTTGSMGSLIGFDAALGSANANRGRRATDPGNQRFAEVYDIAAYAASGSRDAARVHPTSSVRQVSPAPFGTTGQLTVAPPLPPLDAATHAAAERLFHHLTTGGHTPAGSGGPSSAPLVMSLQDSSGVALAQRVVPAHHDDGPQVA